jgi:F-type H+-transporting ATPase subunit gamma
MANLKVLRQRIQSIKATKKITSAMKLIATSHFKKLQKSYQASANYSHGLYECLKAVLDHRDLDHELPPLLQQRTKSKELRIILGSDKGLCGGFNPAIVKHALQEGYHDNMVFLCIGDKVPSLIPSSKKEKIGSTFSMRGKAIYRESLRLAYLLEHKILTNQFDHISVAYNRFRSVLCYTPTIHTLAPFVGSLEENITPTPIVDPLLFDVEPDVPALLKTLAIKNLAAQILHACIESHMSEESARMMAMDTSTRSAEDMLDTLETKYHRSRQSMITNELIEIIAGAESL